jgi:hypothetical protein
MKKGDYKRILDSYANVSAIMELTVAKLTYDYHEVGDIDGTITI